MFKNFGYCIKKLYKKKGNKQKSENDLELNKFTNQIMNKINQSLERFSYNTIISSLHEIYNFYNKLIDKQLEIKNLIDNYTNVLKIMMPVIPHFASECLSEISKPSNLDWPDVNKELLEKNENKIIIQINGKKREIVTSTKNYTEDELTNEIKRMPKISKYLENKEIKKIIYIKNKLINFII